MKRGKIAIDDADTARQSQEVVRETVSEPETSQSAPSSGDESAPNQDTSPPPRRPKSDRENAFDFTAWLVEGVLGVAEEVRHNDLGLSEDFWTHAYAARREALLAARALIDTALENCDRPSSSSRSHARKQRGRVNIDF
jgi:hypothetical protein